MAMNVFSFLSIFFILSAPRLLPHLTIFVTRRMCYKKQKLRIIHEHLGSAPGLFVGSVLLIVWVFRVVLFALFVFVLCRVPNAVRVSLLPLQDCSFEFLQCLIMTCIKSNNASEIISSPDHTCIQSSILICTMSAAFH